MDMASILLLPIIIIVLLCLFRTTRTLGVILVGLGLIIGGIATFVYSNEARNNWQITAAESQNLAMGGIALVFIGIIIWVAYFFSQSSKNSKNQETIVIQTPAVAADNALCSECDNAISPEDAFCKNCGVVLAKDVASYYCSNCSNDVASDDTFCKSCGNALEEEEATNPSCSQCDQEIVPGDSFCRGCGHALTAPIEEPTTPSCSKCGKAITPDNAFCTGCGNAFTEA